VRVYWYLKGFGGLEDVVSVEMLVVRANVCLMRFKVSLCMRASRAGSSLDDD
jgi:hypothetical protein